MAPPRIPFLADLPQHGLAEGLQVAVPLNPPFRGGQTIRRHLREVPWVQFDLFQASLLDLETRGAGLYDGLCHGARLVQN